MVAESRIPEMTPQGGSRRPGLAARATRGISEAFIVICGLFFCSALAGLAADIVARALFHSSVRGMQEVVGLLFTWVFMLGTAALYARNGDVALTIIVRNTGARLRPLIALAVALVIAASMAILFIETLRLIEAQWSIGSADLGIPEPLRFAPLAVAAASIAISSLLEAWNCVAWARFGYRPQSSLGAK
jgi:TRAP-type C4-dicarboxylate transport system permease small subunit